MPPPPPSPRLCQCAPPSALQPPQVRHPCTYGHQKKMPAVYLRNLRRFRRVLEEFSADSLLVMYDEYVRDPQATADAIVRFFPGTIVGSGFRRPGKAGGNEHCPDPQRNAQHTFLCL